LGKLGLHSLRKRRYYLDARFLFRSTVVSIIKSRRMRWAGHVARMGGEEERV
jgi:hypothetical protein